MRLVIATTNAGKLAEFRRMLGDLDFEVVSAVEIGAPDVDEDQPTFEGNADKKARSAALHGKCFALADDSGLEVDALEGAPGVHSARYSGAGAEANITKLLSALESAQNRSARFRCVLALSDSTGQIRIRTSGTCEGRIIDQRRGTRGFGYDPVFVPQGHSRTLAELSEEEKDALSHRGKALREMRAALSKDFR